MSHHAVLRRLGVLLAFVLAAAGCGVPDESRWARGTATPVADQAAVGEVDAPAVALVEVGPVAAAIEVRGVVRIIDPVVVVADGPGRVERRTTAVGDQVVIGDAVLEFSAAADPIAGLRLEILRIEREIALVENRMADVDRLDAEIAAADADAPAGPAFDAIAPASGTVGEYFVSVFDVVANGEPLFALGDADRRHVVAEIPAGATIAAGDDVSLVAVRSALAEPVPGRVSTIQTGDELGPGLFFVELDAAVPFGVGDDVSVVFESTTEASSLRLSADAVRGGGGSEHVIAVGPDGTWSRVAIDVGARTDRFVHVLASEPTLGEGDRVLLP